MPSQIKVDEIKNVAGQYKIKTNVLEGQTTANNMTINAGNITVQGEGTATTNLQQGLAKMWGKIDQQDGSPAIAGSFNLASLTDNSTGNTTHTFTNAMNDDNYSGQGQCNSVYVSTIESYNTGSFRQRVFNLSSSGSDRDDNATAVFGDLA